MPNPNTAKFPTSVATDSDLPVATGSFSTTLTGDITFSSSSIPVASVSAEVPVLLRIEDEIILAVSKSGSNFTSCVRGYSGTSAVAHTTGASVFGYIFAHHFNQLAAEVKAIETSLGASLANIPPALSPNPAGTYGDTSNFPIVVVDTKGRVTSASTTAAVPDLSPNPAGTYGDASNFPVVTVDAKGRVTGVTTQSAGAAKDIPQYFFYRAAIAQGTVASLAFSMKATNQPTASVISSTNNIYGVADFTAGSSAEVWEHFFIPEDFKANSTIEVQFRWLTADTTGNVTWSVNATAVDETESLDVSSWTWTQTVTETVLGTANRLNFSAASINTTGSTIAGKELVFRITRGTDTATGAARLVDVRFKLVRTV